MSLTLIILAFLILWATLYFRMKFWGIAAVFALYFGIIQFFGFVSQFTAVVLWSFLVVFSVIFGLAFIRRRLITTIFFKMLKKALPKMSNTEREAIEAGQPWWEADLFQGAPSWSKIIDMKKPELSKQEEAFINHQVENLCKMLDDWQIQHETQDLPKAIWDYLKKEKFLGMIIAKEDGGLGFSEFAHSTVVMKIASKSIACAVTVMVPNSLGPAELIKHYGTKAQKTYYLPKLATGEEIPCFGLTGIEAGSDASNMTDTGVVCKEHFEGKETIGIRLNWSKRYITLAPVATVLGLAFKMFDPDHLLDDKEEVGITLALIPTSYKGVEIGDRHIPLTGAFMNGPTYGKDVFIPLEWVIGGPKMVGRGWEMLMACLSVGRAISLPALSTAEGKLSFLASSAYATVREQFGVAIGTFEGVQEAMARIGGFTFLQEACRQFTVGGIDEGERSAVVSAIAKYHMTELGRKIINDAMDIHGGKAIIEGPRNYLANAYKLIPISITVEGANILTRSLIIFGQGAIRCHPYLYKEMQAASNDNVKAGFHAFDKSFFHHIGYILSNIVRAKTMWLTNGWGTSPVSEKPLKVYYQQLNRLSAAYSVVAEFALITLQADLKRKEQLSARLGDILSYLYLATTALSYYRWLDDKEALPFLTWAMQYCFHEIQECFYRVFDNFPNRFVACLMKVVAFPFGHRYKAPSDKMTHQVAKTMVQPIRLRDKITAHCYVGDESEPLGKVEQAFWAFYDCKAGLIQIKAKVKSGEIPNHLTFRQKIKHAIENELIDPLEGDKLLAYDRLRMDVIMVDSFTNLKKPV